MPTVPILFFLISYIESTAGIISQSRFVLKKNKRIDDIPYGEFLTESGIECAMKCQSSWNCTAANYLAESGSCNLFYKTCFRIEDAIAWHVLRPPQRQKRFHHISNRKETWDNAKKYCESIGGGLANIMSPTDHEMILSVLDPSIPESHRIWIGGSDRDREGDWVWSNGCHFDDQEFDLWKSGNPDNNNGNEHCQELWYSQWNDGNCANAFTFVCEVNFE